MVSVVTKVFIVVLDLADLLPLDCEELIETG